MKNIFKRKWVWAVIVILFIVVVWIAVAANKKTTYQFATVTRGTITETVEVTGNTTSTQNVSLAFQSGGTIVSTPAYLGESVGAGQTLVSLDASDLQAQLAQAQANVDAQNADLQKLMVGATPQSIAVSQTALATANQNLTNTYLGVANTLTDAETKSIDAVVNQLAPFFINAQTANPQLTFTINDSQLLNNTLSDRGQANTEFSQWNTEMAKISSASASGDLDTALGDAQNHLAVMQNVMEDATQALIDATNLSVTAASNYKTAVASGFGEVNAAVTEVNSAVQNIAAQKATIAQAQAQLNLTLASSSAQDVAAQQAQVEQAQANVQSIQAKIRTMSLVSPIAGTITQQDAKLGQNASPDVPLVTILGNGGFEIDAYVPEVDIGKVATGDAVSMTFDAFPGETFAGSIFYVDPAETNVSGVVDYLVKVSLMKLDPRMKSGLTTNLSIQTQTDNNALILPQYAILQNDQGTFVEVLQKNTAIQLPVTLGIQDASGNVEIASGVTEGEQVINIGLK